MKEYQFEYLQSEISTLRGKKEEMIEQVNNMHQNMAALKLFISNLI